MKKLFAIIAFVGIAGLMAACGEFTSEPPSNKELQAQKSSEMAESVRFTGNAEQDNIKKRLELTSDPSLLGYVVLFNDMGQPVMYTTVEGKITSSGKRLTPPFQVDDGWDCGPNWCDKELPAPSDEGTWGSSAPYIYFWTTSDQYIQWSANYLYSDKPFRLGDTDLVINLVDSGTED